MGTNGDILLLIYGAIPPLATGENQLLQILGTDQYLKKEKRKKSL
jgi:hypothetical protein